MDLFGTRRGPEAGDPHIDAIFAKKFERLYMFVSFKTNG